MSLHHLPDYQLWLSRFPDVWRSEFPSLAVRVSLQCPSSAVTCASPTSMTTCSSRAGVASRQQPDSKLPQPFDLAGQNHFFVQTSFSLLEVLQGLLELVRQIPELLDVTQEVEKSSPYVASILPNSKSCSPATWQELNFRRILAQVKQLTWLSQVSASALLRYFAV